MRLSRRRVPSFRCNGVCSAPGVSKPCVPPSRLEPHDGNTGTIASLVAFGINYNAAVVKCPDSVYIVFIILMCSAFFVALFGIVKPADVRRDDGTAIAHYPHKGFWLEIKAQRQIFMDWRMLVLILPMFGSENAIIIFSTLNCKFQGYAETQEVDGS